MSEYKTLFHRAFSTMPELIGFAGTNREFHTTQLTIEGEIPQAISGTFYRNGAAQHERGEQRYQHLFEGDGMIQSFQIANGKIQHQGRFVKTPKFTKEQQAGKFLYSGPDSKLPHGMAVSNADSINTANTNVIAVGDDMWALWEAGSPVAVDSNTLKTNGIVNLGKNSKFGNALKGMPFSAHPKIDPSGDIWNFGASPTGHIVLYHLNSQGKMLNTKVIATGYSGGMLHDFLITHRHILLILPSLTRDRSKKGFFEGIQFDNKLPMKVLVIDKQELTVKRTFELDAGFAFHYGNAWEDAKGTIHFDASLYPNVDVLHRMRDLMKGISLSGISAAQTTIFSLAPSGRVTKNTIGDNSEFPRVSPQLTGLRNRYLYSIGSTGVDIWSDTLNRYDLETGKVDAFVYGKDFLVEEHVLINPGTKEHHGFLIGTALHVPSRRTCLNIFHADNITQGPVCRAWLPYHIPLGFHGNFVNRAS